MNMVYFSRQLCKDRDQQNGITSIRVVAPHLTVVADRQAFLNREAR
jgi:hypothetical protein